MSRRKGKVATAAASPAVPEIYHRTDISSETLFQAIGRLRKEAQDEIDRLLAFLDSLEDTDVDAGIEDEPHDDIGEAEPSLGWTNMEPDQGWQAHCDIDAELDNCDDEDSDHSGAADFDGLREQDSRTSVGNGVAYV